MANQITFMHNERATGVAVLPQPPRDLQPYKARGAKEPTLDVIGGLEAVIA